MTEFPKTKPLGLCDALLGEEGSVLVLQLTSGMQADCTHRCLPAAGTVWPCASFKHMTLGKSEKELAPRDNC